MNILEVNVLLLFINATIFIYIFNTKLTKKIFLVLTTIQLIIINGLRDVTIGVDTFRYSRHFTRVNSLSSFQEMIEYDHEIGYVVYQRIVGLFTENFNMYLFITSCLLFILLAYFIYKNSPNYFLSYFIFISLEFFEFTLSGIRQSIAMMIGIYTFHFALRKDKVKYCLVLFLALTFHSSAIILVPVYFLVNANFKKIYMLLIVPVYLGMMLFADQIGVLMTNLYYGELSMLERYESSGTIGTLSIFIFGILLFGYIFHSPFKEYTSRKNKALFNILLASFFLQGLSSVMYLFTRINLNYLIFLIIYIPSLIETTKERLIDMDPRLIWGMKKLFQYIIVFVFLLYLLSNIQNNTSRLLPYRFYWT